MATPIRSHRELKVYQAAAAARRRVFELSRRFPPEEMFGLTRQSLNSARGCPAAIGEAWRKRRYKPNWISKLTDSEQEAAETQVHMETAFECGYITKAEFEDIYDQYDKILGQITLMAVNADKWVIKK
jgi:four helix bundle protein